MVWSSEVVANEEEPNNVVNEVAINELVKAVGQVNSRINTMTIEVAEVVEAEGSAGEITISLNGIEMHLSTFDQTGR